MLAKPPFSEYESVREQWEALLNSPERIYRRDAPDYLEERLATLALQAADLSDGIYAFEGNFQRFIGPNTALFAGTLSAGFVMDDHRMYQGITQWLRRPASPHLAPELTGFRSQVALASHLAVERYFGPSPGDTKLKQHNELLYAHTKKGLEPPRFSVTAFKDFAYCAQRAALANDTHHIFGFAPVYEMGMTESGKWRRLSGNARHRRPKDTLRRTPHTFLIIGGEEGNILYDPTNPGIIMDNRGRFLETLPAIYKIDDSLTQNRAMEWKGQLHAVKLRQRGYSIHSSQVRNFTTHDEGSLLAPIG